MGDIVALSEKEEDSNHYIIYSKDIYDTKTLKRLGDFIKTRFKKFTLVPSEYITKIEMIKE